MMSMVEAMLAAGDSSGSGFTTPMPLVVFTVFFGPLPPWLPLTLHSMAANARVRFVVVGDAAPPSVVPPNVRFVEIGWQALQTRLSELTGRRVAYREHYKANDVKPLLPTLYPELAAGYEWWAWADLDVVFGDLLAFLGRAEAEPACCRGLEVKCDKRARRDPASPCSRERGRPRDAADTFWDKGACACAHGERVTAYSPLYPNPWRKKCWGPFTAFRAEGNGTALFRATPRWREMVATHEYAHLDEWWGPFAGRGYETMGEIMTRLSNDGSLVMSKAKHPFAEAKTCADVECTFCPCGALRLRLDGARLVVNDEEVPVLHLAESKPAWRGALIAPYAPPPPGAPPPCFEVDDLGELAPDPALAWTADVARRATRLARHRPASAKAAATLRYPAARAAPLRVRPCDAPPPAAAAAAAAPGVAAALADLASRYDAFTAAERSRALEWLCAWARVSAEYAAALGRVDETRRAARELPGTHGRRGVRTPQYAGERLGWYRREAAGQLGTAEAACRAPAAAGCPPRSAAVPGTPCLADAGSAEAGRAPPSASALFDAYTQLQHAQAAEVARAQKWRCSWLYMLKACDAAEAVRKGAPRGAARKGYARSAECRRVRPPAHEGAIGWGGVDVVANASTHEELGALLFRWRCW